MISHPGARAGRALASRLQGPLPAGCRPAAHMLAGRWWCLSGWAEAPGCVSHLGARAGRALVSRLQGPLPAGCRPAAHTRGGGSLAAFERVGGSPRLCFAPWCARWQGVGAAFAGPLPAGCRPAAHMLAGRWCRVCRGLYPRAAALRLICWQGVGVAFAGHFTRGLPPCGSSRLAHRVCSSRLLPALPHRVSTP
ncbi:MAG: hypothetical protein RLZZ436_4665 [Planctomycetota bacterium]